MRAVVGQHGMDCVGHGPGECAQEVSCDASCGLFVQLYEGKLGDPVDCNQQVESTLSCLDLGNIDVEITEGVGLELALARSGGLDIGQSGDAMPLQAAVQRRPRQVRNSGLKGIQAVVQRQQSMPTECHHHGLVLRGQHGRLGLSRSCWQVMDRAAGFPFGDGFRIDPVALGSLARPLRLS